MSRALVIQTAPLGDVVLTSPLLQKVAALHGAVDVLTTPQARPLVATLPFVERSLVFDKRKRDRGLRGLIRTAARLRRRGYDVAYIPHRSFRTALLAFLAGIPVRIGFDDTPARCLYTAARPRRGRHESARLASLVDRDWAPPLRVGLTSRDRAAAARWLELGGITSPYAVLAPGSARPTKRWPYYRELAVALSARMPVVLIGEARDRVFPDEPSGAPSRTVDLCGVLSLREAAAAIAGAAVVVANDSAPMHLAAALGTPVVALFGPTDPALGFAPQGPQHRCLRLNLPCRPCSEHGGDRCPLGHHRCLRDLSVEDVLSAVVAAVPALESGVP